MSDLISRQAAKDELRTCQTYLFDTKDDDLKISLEDAEYVIEQMPSAEPEKHYDEWCTDCKEYDRERHCCPRWNRVIRETLNDTQPVQKTGKWELVSQGVSGGYYVCSECDNRALYAEDGVEELSKHCPFCGARMMEQ